jgi:probable rRNA maturation factor
MTAQNNRGATAALNADIVCDAGDWPDDIDVVVDQAANAVAAWPGLIKGTADVSIALSSDAEVAALNAQYRGKPKPTNVLSFPAGAGAPKDFLGDIILAAETVRREADDQATPFAHHVQHLVVHGILHLLGFDHETAADAERMEALEIGILAGLSISNPYTGDLDAATKE